MMRRQGHLLQDPIVRLDFNKGTLANEHKDGFIGTEDNKSRSCNVKSGTKRHTEEAD